MRQAPMGEFLEACGATGPLAFRVLGPAGEDVGLWTIPQPFALVGREARAELKLPGEPVSRKHAYLQVVGGRVFCIDLGSRDGLTWGGIAEHSGWLELGGEVGVGPYRLRLEGGVPRRDPGELQRIENPLAAAGGAGLPSMTLVVPRKAEGPSRWRVRKVLTLIGRGPDCCLRIQDESISRHHAALLRTPAGAWIVDLISREGVRVGGARVRWSRLHDGDHVHVGRYRLVARLGVSAGLPAPAGTGPGSDANLSIPPLPSLAHEHFPAILDGMAPPATIPRSGAIRQILRGRTPEQIELVESLMEPMVQHLGQMQQQMFEQLHQAMLAMFQMFGSLHGDQMATVREELEHIRQLGLELQGLRAEQARTGRPQDPGTPDAPRSDTDPTTSAPSEPETTGSATPERPFQRRVPPNPPEAPKRPPIPMSVDPPENLHARIARRMIELQGERQTRLQRLVGFMKGGSPPTT